MFALRYSPAAGPGIWAASAERISGPRGWVEPFRHPMIEARGVVDGRGNLGVAVLERPHPSSGAIPAPSLAAFPGDSEDELASARELTRRWPLHWFWIEIAEGSLAIEASPSSSQAPAAAHGRTGIHSSSTLTSSRRSTSTWRRITSAPSSSLTDRAPSCAA
jgi:hypothetical protein